MASEHQDNSKQKYEEALELFRASSAGVYYQAYLEGADLDLLLNPLCRSANMKYNMEILKNLLLVNGEYDNLLSEVMVTDEYYAAIAAVKFYSISIALQYFNRTGYEHKVFERLSDLEATIYSMEPLKLRPEIIGIYALLILKYSEFVVNKKILNYDSENYKTSIELLKMGIKAYEDYQDWVAVKPWTVYKILKCGSNMMKRETDSILPNRYKLMKITLIQASINTKDNQTVFNGGIQGMKLALELYHQNLIDLFSLVFLISCVGLEFLRRSYLSQANHLFAVAMHLAVEHRRSLPEPNRPTVNTAQALISIGYIQYGIHLLNIMADIIIDDVVDKSNMKPPICHSECERILESDGLKVYETTFPTNYELNTKVLRSVYKKTVLWFQRTKLLDKDKKNLTEEDIQVITGRLAALKPMFS